VRSGGVADLAVDAEAGARKPRAEDGVKPQLARGVEPAGGLFALETVALVAQRRCGGVGDEREVPAGRAVGAHSTSWPSTTSVIDGGVCASSSLFMRLK